MHAGVRAARPICKACHSIIAGKRPVITLSNPPPPSSIAVRALSTRPPEPPLASTSTSTPPQPGPSKPSDLPGAGKQSKTPSQIESRLSALLTSLNLSAKARARAFSSAVAALDWERKLGQVGGKINQATGYEDIERLRITVAEREKRLLRAREDAVAHKKIYTDAVALRAASQRETNDLLQRKSSWTSTDVMRFTELVQQDHQNERSEAKAKELMESGEEEVEKGFSDLMQAILERYHEEQVWSDKIRSLSTYGSLGITTLNVLLFIITILLVEPWKRKRLVEGVESRLRTSTIQGQDATLASLSSLQSLLTDAQIKLDSLLSVSSATSSTSSSSPSPDESVQVQGPDDARLYPFSEGGTLELDGEGESTAVSSPLLERTREKELVVVGVAGAVAGVGISLLWGLLGWAR